jgi:hypothetical protein
MESRKSHPKGREIVEKRNLLMRKKHALDCQHPGTWGLVSRTQAKRLIFVVLCPNNQGTSHVIQKTADLVLKVIAATKLHTQTKLNTY